MQNKTLQMKKALRTALLVLLLCVEGIGKMTAQTTFTVGDLNYSVNPDGTTVTVTGHVDGTAATGNLTIPDFVTYEGNNYLVTIIGDGAFNTCFGFTGSLTIPNSVIIIGNGAFYHCEGFTGSLTIPNSVTTIGAYAFYYCDGFTGNLIIPNSVINIGDYAFDNCRGFSGSLIIGNSVTEIGSYAFEGCTGFIGNLTIPSSVTSIGEYAFYFCSGFSGDLTIPNSVTVIHHCAFMGCSGITSLYIPDSVMAIEYYVFSFCNGIEQITVASGNTVYDSRNNCNGIIETATNSLITGCKNTVIPNSVVSIGDTAFSGSDMTSFVIPGSVSYIGNAAFQYCYDLTSITLPNSVTIIGDYAFSNCNSLNTVIALSATPADVYDYTFDSDINQLIVCCGNKETYEASDWVNYFAAIDEDCSPHEVIIDENNMSGGNVSASVTSTELGDEVQLVVMSDEGMELASIVVFNANNPEQTVPVYPLGKTSYVYGFIMPPFDVVITATFGPVTTIGENNEALASVYPNPTNGKVTIEFDNLKHITISNMLGQTIYDGNVSGSTFEYDFSKHKTGFYLIRIETANGVAVKKVSVTR